MSWVTDQTSGVTAEQAALEFPDDSETIKELSDQLYGCLMALTTDESFDLVIGACGGEGLAALHALGRPLLLGVSRKSFIARLAGDAPVDRRLPGSLAAALAGLDRGVRVLRVHDVAETVQAVRLWHAIRCSCDTADR